VFLTIVDNNASQQLLLTLALTLALDIQNLPNSVTCFHSLAHSKYIHWQIGHSAIRLAI
jgi:hypothetical protein